MTIVALIPIKTVSRRVQGKNFRLLNGRPLFHYIIEAALNSGFTDVYVDTDSGEVKSYALARNARVIDRPPALSADTANGNDLLIYESSVVEADIYVQLFATAPLLSSNTIRQAVQTLVHNPVYDSALTVNNIFSWFWFDGQPVNYEPRTLPRSQDARPITRETTGLYAIRRQALLDRQCRIGAFPAFVEVNETEGLDIDTEADFRYVEFLLQQGLATDPFTRQAATN